MQKIIDKSLLFGLCLLTLSFFEVGWLSVVAMLVAVAVSSICGYLENKHSGIFCVAYVVLCIFIAEFVIFLPLIVYDCADRKQWVIKLCWVAALPMVFMLDIPQAMAAIALSAGVAFLLQYRTSAQMETHAELLDLKDDAKERSDRLERKNRDLMEAQDYEIRLATLAERNRIAREIHDNVGHMITRSLLQIDAMRITHAKEEELTDELGVVKSTLSDAMDSIRSSVHDLHDESIDLKSSIETMLDGFVFCPVKLRFDAGELPSNMKYCFTAILREALSNIARHSNATQAEITVMEHPSFCQLVISDNGTAKSGGDKDGIGLQNMADRVDALGGVFRIERGRGFRVFISVPK